MAKPTRLKFVGPTEEVRDQRGHVVGERPAIYHQGIPARDLDESDIAALSDEQIKTALSGERPLYVDPDAEKARKERERAKVAKQNADNVAARKAAKQSAPASEPQSEPVAQEPLGDVIMEHSEGEGA